MKESLQWVMAIIALLFICFLSSLVLTNPQSGQSSLVNFAGSQQNPAGLPVASGLTQCEGAPFVVPTSGWIGILYGDSIMGTTSHSGLDIFGLEGNDVTPVYAAYGGYLTRLPEWTSAVIIRHPEDPVGSGRQIWTYYTHMADAEGNDYILDQIPPGTYELPVKQGTLLGYQGDYSGRPWPIDTHLHFSLVLDDGNGQFLNETNIANTIDPSPYLGMRLNTRCGDRPPVCRSDFSCP